MGGSLESAQCSEKVEEFHVEVRESVNVEIG